VTATSAQLIIVNYNAGEWLSRALESAVQFSRTQITVIDNNSTDQSVAQAQQLLRGETRIDWINNPQNIGFAAANNQILSRLENEFAILMNPDCQLNADTLPKLFTAFKNNPSMGLASCRILNWDGTVQSSCKRRFPTPWSALVRMLQLHRLFPNNPRFANFDYGHVNGSSALEVEFVEAVSGAFMMVRKAALDEVGLLDEAYFMHCEDLDWCKRFEQSGWQVGYVDAATVVHAKGVSSRSRPIRVLWTLHAGMNRFFDKFYKTEYSWLTRYTVKLGIGLSFLSRVFYQLLKAVWVRDK